MQTFLPYLSFARSASALDWRRLGKQRVEAKQILTTLDGTGLGWRNHPAVRMWRGFEGSLAAYGYTVCLEWRKRGYQDTLLDWFAERLDGNGKSPPWLGNADFHYSHQSNLVRKLSEHYGPMFHGVPDDLPYIWPV